MHPDNFVTADAQEQRIAMQKSTEVNDALKTLKDPILRAEAIIALNTGEAGFRTKEHARCRIFDAAIRMARRARKY